MDPTDISAVPAGVEFGPSKPGDSTRAPVDRTEFVRTALTAHEGTLLRYALSLLEGDLDQARDCVQDTFVRLWDQDLAELSGHLAPWLFTVCRNRVRDIQRKDRRMTALDETELATRPDAAPSPADAAVHRESATTALAFLSELPPPQREVVRLKFQNQLSYQEIANITALSVTNVGFLLHTALKTLRHRMEQHERRRPNPTRSQATLGSPAL